MKNKFLKYIENNDENLNNLSDLSEHDKNISKNLLSLLSESIKNNEYINCNHDLEELCLYVEGKSNTQELIKNQILECDSCFENYDFLKNQVNEIKNITPPYFKDKVYEKVLNNKIDEKIVKESIWNIIKRNKLLKYSSSAIAASLLLFFTLNPLNQDMSDFHKSKLREREVSNQDTINNQVSSKIDDKKDDSIKPSENKVTEQKSNKPIIAGNSISDDIKLKAQGIINKKIPNPSIVVQQKKEITINSKIEPNKPKKDDSIDLKTYSKIIEPSNKKIIIDSSKTELGLEIPSSRLYLPKEQREEKEKPQKSSSIEIMQKAKPNSELLDNVIKTKPSIKKSFENLDEADDKIKEEESDRNINELVTKNQAPKSEPIIVKKGVLDNDDNKNDLIRSSDNLKKTDTSKDKFSEPSMANAPAPALKQQEYNKIKQTSELNTSLRLNSKVISLNFTSKENGFIVLKDKDNKIVYSSYLLKKGIYNKFIVNINPEIVYVKYFYINSNSNNIFDQEDIIDKSVLVTEN